MRLRVAFRVAFFGDLTSLKSLGQKSQRSKKLIEYASNPISKKIKHWGILEKCQLDHRFDPPVKGGVLRRIYSSKPKAEESTVSPLAGKKG